MKKTMFIYFIGIGSNIRPAQHIPTALAILLKTSRHLVMSRIIQTAPVGLLDDRHYFLNLAIMIRSALSAQILKNRLNEIEVRLGRDRTDPDRKVKNNPIDLDILFQLEERERTILPAMLPAEPYLQVPLVELLHFLGYRCPIINQNPPPGVGLEFQHIIVGEREISLMMHTTGVISAH